MSFLINIKDWTLEVMELTYNTNEKKISYRKNNYVNRSKLRY